MPPYGSKWKASMERAGSHTSLWQCDKWHLTLFPIAKLMILGVVCKDFSLWWVAYRFVCSVTNFKHLLLLLLISWLLKTKIHCKWQKNWWPFLCAATLLPTCQASLKLDTGMSHDATENNSLMALSGWERTLWALLISFTPSCQPAVAPPAAILDSPSQTPYRTKQTATIVLMLDLLRSNLVVRHSQYPSRFLKADSIAIQHLLTWVLSLFATVQTSSVWLPKSGKQRVRGISQNIGSGKSRGVQ